MDGLIKGLIHVALGNDERDDDRRDSEPRDERSRSTWAQVASGEQDHDESATNQWNRKEENHGRKQDWESGGSRPSHPHQTMQPEGGRDDYRQSQQNKQNLYNENENSGRNEYRQPQGGRQDDGNHDDGWETVGKKHPKQPPHKIQTDQWNDYKRPASDQHYSDEVEFSANFEPTKEELHDLSNACNKLWELDLNRLVPNKDYQIDCGEGKKIYEKEDMAQGSLFTWLKEDVLRKPTFSRFCSLLDNYNPHEGYKEQVTSQELQEQAAFIEEICRTAPIKYLQKYLAYKGIVSDNIQDFKRTMTSLWFDLYNRGGTSGSSSAFEHVFVGEIKQKGEQEVSGFHNWLQFYLEESKGKVDYQGYIYPRRRGSVPDSETQLLTVQFEWNGVLKSLSSSFIGVSPEFEIALYTLCFYAGQEENHVQMGPYYVNIKCYRFGNKMGSTFPIAE
ncbi:poly(U)-specific endoribonuclease-A-like [Impatiens glandulifera]|uniref:poly(U)-specific endoribonuclease-A-like n=1 Tax=Impatiens glandulifera TaxID=253017 RepID=UPI001FB16483|nr:poly(U)-specific endoribonuclease-A-like [Impatiens glandulifera]